MRTREREIQGVSVNMRDQGERNTGCFSKHERPGREIQGVSVNMRDQGERNTGCFSKHERPRREKYRVSQ